MSNTGTDLANIRSNALAASIDGGDKEVERIVREAARQIGVAVAGAVHLLAPDMVVLGGGMVEEMVDQFVKEVSAAAKKRVLPAFADSFEVVAANRSHDAWIQ